MKNILILFVVIYSGLIYGKGKVVYLKGTVYLNDKKLSKKSILEKNDIVRTGAKSLAVLKLDDGSNIKLNEKSSITIAKAGKVQSLIKVKKGSVFFRVLKKNFVDKKIKKDKKRKFVVQYKSVAMGVRGTEFFVSGGKDNSQDVWMCVNEGQVAVKSKSEKKATVVNAGEGIVVKDAKKTSKPRPLAWTRKLNWKMNPKQGDLSNKVSIEEAYNDLLEHDYD